MSEEKAEVVEMPKRSARDRILERGGQARGEPYEIKEWDVTVELRSMTIAQKGQLIGDEEPTPTKVIEFLPEVIIFTCYDAESGEAVFSSEDLDWLKEQPANVIERVATEGLRVSGMEEAADEAAKKSS